MNECKFEQKETKESNIAPNDIKVIAWLIISISMVSFFLGIAILLQIAMVTDRNVRVVLFGLWELNSGFEFGVYHFVVGILGLIAGLLIRRFSIVGCFMLGFLVLNSFVNVLMIMPEFPVSSTVGLFFKICLVAWLIRRRHLFKMIF